MSVVAEFTIPGDEFSFGEALATAQGMEIRPLLELLRDHEDELPADWLRSDGQRT